MSEAEVKSITFNNVKFGEVTVDQRDVLEFPYGLPGFERFKQFGLIETEEEAPFYGFFLWMSRALDLSF